MTTLIDKTPASNGKVKSSDEKTDAKTKTTSLRQRPSSLRVLAIASGKGGVGKSTISVLFAQAAQSLGLNCALIDADIHGPTLPVMFGIADHPMSAKKKDKLVPVSKSGLLINSIGFFTSNDGAVAWRGPMAGRAAQQLLLDTDWGKTDLLIVDLPPGSSDVHLSLSQSNLIDGFILVSTPQKISFADAIRAGNLFVKFKISLCGIVENMSWFEDEQGNYLRLMGQGAGEQLSRELDCKNLFHFPQRTSILAHSDSGDADKLFDELPDDLQRQWTKFVQTALKKFVT